jgi:hypothetical protein
MEQYLDYSDERHNNGCIYCGRKPDSVDHIPARTFLDEPYPDNLQVLPVCTSCNNESSLDEEYVSFLIYYLKHQESGALDEKHMKNKFSHAEALEDRVLNGLNINKEEKNSRPIIDIETDRIKKVLNKYAFAHFCFERGEHPNGDAININFAFASQLTEEQIKIFNTISKEEIFPEIGSRLFQRVFENGNSWMVVQENNYRYFISQNQPYVRIVIYEFLFAEIIFDDL